MNHLQVSTSLFLALASGLVAQTAIVSTSTFSSNYTAFDQIRQRLVLGLGSKAIWEWDGVDWARAPVDLPEPPRNVLYDPVAGNVVFHAGNRLLAYDGHGIRHVVMMPDNSSYWLAFDGSRQRLQAMALGFGTAHYEFDGAAWQPLSVPFAAAVTVGLAYDSARSVLVAQTGAASPSATWEKHGATWVQAASNAGYPGPLAFDPVRQQVIGVGATTKTWDGVAWTTLPNTGTPSFRTFGADPARGLVWTSSGGRDIFAWNGQTWSVRLRAPHVELVPGAFTYDAARGRAVLLGHDSLGVVSHHEWDGERWLDRSASMPAWTSTPVALAYDAVRGETVVYHQGTTQAWNGSSWRLAATNGPSPRSAPAMTEDVLRGRVVLVGGRDATGYLQDHWEWDGAAWSQVAATTPMGATAMAAGFDPLRNQLVVVTGGGDTFEYDSSGWRLAASGGAQSGNLQLVWDIVRQRLQGRFLGVAQSHQEWDGMQWTPRGSIAGRLAFDPLRSVLLAYASDTLTTYSYLPAATVRFGAPCGAGTPPTLATFGRPQPGSRSFHVDLRAGGASQPALLGFGLAAGSVPLGNQCTLLVQNAIGSLLATTDPRGFLHQPIALPNDLALRGVTFVAQAAVFDPASAGGFAMTQGWSVQIGD